MLDFAELPVDGEDLEKLVRELCLVLGYRVQWSGRGADGGRDLLIEEPGDSLFGGKYRTWLVSCKHTARANGGVGRSVSTSDVGMDGGIVDAVMQHRASGFLLVCSTQPSSALVARLEAIEREKGVPTHVWDGVTIERMLSNPRAWPIAQRFFPVSAEAAGWRIFGTESPNRFVGVTRGFYIHIANRHSSGLYFQLDSIDQRLDKVALEDLPPGHELRPRGVFCNDKGGHFTWYFDYLYGEARWGSEVVAPEASVVEDMTRRLEWFDYEDGQGDSFEITMRRVYRAQDNYDRDHYQYYDELPEYFRGSG